jgi:DNA-binding GntR family transcriptional regulator
MLFSQAESVSEQVAQYIAEQIISGELVEGERIQEMRIVNELKVSRGSVREALLLLERWRLIDIFPNKGAMVTELSIQQVSALYEILSLLLQSVARKAAQFWQPQMMDKLLVQINLLHAHIQQHDLEAFYRSSFDLFRMAYVFANNPYLEATLNDLQAAVRRCYYWALQSDKRELDIAFVYLQNLVESVLARDAEQAAKVVNDFCIHQRDLVLSALLQMKQIELAWAARQGGGKRKAKKELVKE